MGELFAQVVQADLASARDDEPQVVLLQVVVPRLDHAGQGDREVGLTEARVERIVLTQQLHERAAIVEQNAQRFALDAVNHRPIWTR